MARLTRLNTQSIQYTGNVTFKPDNNRGFFFIVMGGSGGTIEFGDGGGKIPLDPSAHYAPPISPLGRIAIETAGTFIVHSNVYGTE